MTFNKIPLALGFDGTTGNASGLVEFTLDLSNVGDVCTNAPTDRQALVYDSGSWCPSTIVTGGGGGGGYTPPSATAKGDIIVAAAAGSNQFNDTITSAALFSEGIADNQILTGTIGPDNLNVALANTQIPVASSTTGFSGITTTQDLRTFLETDAKLSSLTDVLFADVGGAAGEGDGALPQHVQWNGTNWVNAYEDEQYIRIRNNTGSTLTRGQAVYVSGTHGGSDIPAVALARADSESTMPAVGVLHDNLPTNNTGLAVTFGTAQISVSMDGSPAISDTVYVSPTTAGKLTADKPTGSTHLIQNVGIVTRVSGGERIKVTGVGRANDIPNTLTLGQTTITSTSAKFANVQDHSVMITDSTSAVSSVSGVSGSLVYFSGTDPRPVITDIPTIMQEAGVRVEDKTLADLSDAQYNGDAPTDGQALIWQNSLGKWQNQSVKSLVGNIESSQGANGTTTIKNVPSVPVGKTGDGDITANTILYFSGTDASSTDTLTLSTDGRNLIESGSATNVSANDIDLVNGSITTAPTTGNHIANKTYVDGVNNTQHNRLFAVGTKTDSIANTAVYLGWEFDAVSALSVSDSGGVITIGGTGNTEITFGEAGDYMIDCTARCNANNRIELFVKGEYYDATQESPAFVAYNRLQNSNYAARDLDQNTGGTTLSLLLSLNQNDKLRFEAEADADGTAVLLVNGTFLRIVKLA